MTTSPVGDDLDFDCGDGSDLVPVEPVTINAPQGSVFDGCTGMVVGRVDGNYIVKIDDRPLLPAMAFGEGEIERAS
jgi:ribosomal protein L21E